MPNQRTFVARSILRVLYDTTAPMTRREIAHRLGKKYLMRNDIRVLNRLVDLDLVYGIKRPLWEVMEERTNGQWSGGRPNMQKYIFNASRIWFYEITSSGSEVVHKMNQSNQPRTQPNQLTRQRNQQPRTSSNHNQPITPGRWDTSRDKNPEPVNLRANEHNPSDSIVGRVLDWFLDRLP